jgi:hypothetical protein
LPLSSSIGLFLHPDNLIDWRELSLYGTFKKQLVVPNVQ